MTTDRQDPATDTKAEGLAREAALFVTFYGPRETAPPLYKRLRSLVQKAQEEANTNGGGGPHTSILSPRVYYPPAAHDSTVIRFAINAPKEEHAATAWESTRGELQETLKDKALPKDWWGYTLTYQAVLNPGIDLVSVPDELLSTVRRIDTSESLEPLEQADISGGRLWLMDVPVRGDGLAAATVYVALSTSEKEGSFKQVLFEPELLMLDLIAHKGYHLKREYRGDLQRDYEEGLKAFRESTYELLSDLGLQVEETARLDDLARKYKVLIGFVSELRRLRISVAQQLPNYREWQQQIGANSITEYHYGHLEMAHRELELMVAQGKDALETANTAMSMAQIHIDKALVRAEKEQERTQREMNKAQEGRQRRVQTLVAVLAMALAVPQLINQEAAQALITLDYSTLLLVLVQIVITAAVALVVVEMVRRLNA